MTLEELQSRLSSGTPVHVEVHAVDPSIYLVFHRADKLLQPLRDHAGTLRFSSRYSAFHALAKLGIDSVAFVHRSAYGEMIGSGAENAETELRQTVTISHLA